MAQPSALRLALCRFAVLSLVCVLGLALSMGIALSSLLSHAVSQWEWENTAAFARRSMELTGIDSLFTADQDPATRERWGHELARLFAGFPEIVRVKVWDRRATVLWSDEPRLIGRRFPDNDELQVALQGRVAVEIKTLKRGEHLYERDRFDRLAEIYVPIFARPTGGVVGVLELYKVPTRLFATLRWGQLVIWTISLLGGLALYAVLLPMARQVYGREVQQETLRAYASRLEAEVAERTREVQRQHEQLLQAQKMEALGRLAGGVAHDFNNLLTVIQGRSDLLQARLAADHGLRRHAELISTTAGRAAALTQELLAFSRKQVLQPQVLDLNAVVVGVEKMLRRLIGEEISLVTALDARGPIQADLPQLEQVLVNLVVNARDAMPDGGTLMLRTADVPLDAPEARLHGLPAGHYVVLAVTDTGVGMDAATAARIFEPFFTTKEPGKGTGLGLSMVYGMVKQSGGAVAVHTEPGRGATFRVYLPRADGAPRAPAVEGVRPVTRGCETVLVVEDEAAVRDLARELLESQGYHVLTAEDGPSALAAVDAHPGPIHLLLTDVVMPRMSGSELARRTRRRRAETTVLFMSGYMDDTLVRHGVSQAEATLLQKPFTSATLASRVREVLDARSASTNDGCSRPRTRPCRE